MRDKKAFTLVELLVVISIIAVLLAIMMPALNRARESSKKVWCLTNMRGAMLATVTYSESYLNHLPFSGRLFPHMGMLDFPNLLVTQGLDPRKLHCPADTYKPGVIANYWLYDSAFKRKMDDRDHLGRKPPKGVNSEVPYSYYYNAKMYVECDATRNWILWSVLKKWKMADVKNPSRLIPYTCFDTPGKRHSNKNVTAKNFLKQGGHQAAFLDGHAEFVQFTKITPREPQSYDERNLDWTKYGIRGVDVK